MIDVDDPIWDALAGLRLDCGMSAAADRRCCDAAADRRCCDAASDDAVVPAEGNLVCSACNSIVSRQLDYGAEWRYYGAEDPRGANPTRCCPPSNGLISTLGSVVSGCPRRRASQWANRTAASAASAQASQAAGRQVQRYQTWSSLTYRERVLCGIFDLLTVNAAQNGLPACILEDAKNLYKRVSDQRITRGENRAAVIAVSVYVACRRCGAPRSLKEIGAMFSVRPTAMTKAHRQFGDTVEGADDGACCGAADFVGRFCSRLAMDAEAVAFVRATVVHAEAGAEVCDAMPTSIVAGAISIANDALGLGLRRDAIAEACVVAPVTVAKLAARLRIISISFRDGGQPPPEKE